MDKVYRAHIDDEITMKSFGSQYRPLEKRRDLSYLPSPKTMTPKQRKLIPALPFCQIILKAPKPSSVPYPKRLKTLGDHLKKKRLDLKLQQKDVAKKLGVSETTIYNWENNQASPSLYFIPKIIKFLGYLPDYIPDDAPVVKTLGEKIAISRQFLGLTQKELAHRLKIDPSTLARWEKDKGQPSKKQQKLLNNLFTLLSSGHPALPLNLLLLKSLKRKSPS